MEHRTRGILPMAVLGAVILVAPAARAAKPKSHATGSPVKVRLTLDTTTYKVTPSINPVPIYTADHESVRWKKSPKSAPFKFTIEFKYQPGDKVKHLPNPVCSGTDELRECNSIAPDSSYAGLHKYSIWVIKKDGTKVETDPEVTVDP